jgi:hypothetical protein
MIGSHTRRAWLARAALSTVAMAGRHVDASEPPRREDDPGARAFEFLLRCRRDDGGFAPSPDPAYAGESDTKLSDLAAVTYAAVLARTLGRQRIALDVNRLQVNKKYQVSILVRVPEIGDPDQPSLLAIHRESHAFLGTAT